MGTLSSLRETIAVHPGRTVAVAIGAAAIVGGALHHNAATGKVLIVGGFVLVVLGCVLPWIKRIHSAVMDVDLHDPPDIGQLSSSVEQIRADKPDPEEVDLPGEDEWDGARYRLGEQAIDYLLTNLTPALADCEARLYLYDATAQKLLPAHIPSTATNPSVHGWNVGQGVTGLAYQNGKYVYAWGNTAHDSTYGLTPEMQERYEKLTAVAAAPLADRAGKVIGVMSLSSTVAGTALASEVGYHEHLALAQQVSVALVDLMRVTS